MNTHRGDGRVRVGLLQTRCDSNPATNLDRSLGLAEEAVRQGAQILCTAELHCSHYFCQTEDHRHFGLAEPVPGPTTAVWQEWAARRGVVVVASLFEERAPGLCHNTAVAIDADGALLGRYRKMHIPDDPAYYEKFYFAPGDLGFRAWSTRFGRIGILICWDQWYPEAARLTAMQGADILFYPTAIGWHPAEQADPGPRQLEAWEIIQRGHAIANGCFVAAVNRVGFEPSPPGDGLQFWGRSFVAGPMGEILARAGQTREEALVAEVDLAQVAATRQQWPFWRDRRVDAYGGVTARWGDAPSPA